MLDLERLAARAFEIGQAIDRRMRMLENRFTPSCDRRVLLDEITSYETEATHVQEQILQANGGIVWIYWSTTA